MIKLHANDWYTITGRGRIASVNLREVEGCPERINTVSDIPVKVGEHVVIDGADYEVRGIEYATALVYPSFIKPDVGLLVTPVAPPTCRAVVVLLGRSSTSNSCHQRSRGS